MAELLGADEIRSRLDGTQWSQEGDRIVCEYKLGDFKQAVVFVNRVAEVAEKQGHHPDITIHGWNKVRLSVTNHSAGGLTDADFELAQRIDALQ